MNEIEVRIVRLAPQRVAAAYGFGPGPEEIAWKHMADFVEEKRLDKDNRQHRYFGFNNPSPSPGSPNYGYEQWITIGPEVETSGDIKIKNFEGGLYAVTRTWLGEITRTWEKLFAWRETSPYRAGSHQWLEEALDVPLDLNITEEMVLDLYIPIAE